MSSSALEPQQRTAALAGVTGHVAESVIDHVHAVEIERTLRAGHVARMSRRAIALNFADMVL